MLSHLNHQLPELLHHLNVDFSNCLGIDDYRQKIDNHLSELIPMSSPLFPSLYEGGRYALLAPGKRIRPLLTLYTVEMLQKSALNAALTPACALEFVHTYSLIHDDLPCMDNDDFRRGRPTLHRVYTQGHAVLVGDYLLTYAFELIAQAPFLSDRQKISLVKTLTTAAGGEGMIGGQIMDIEGSSLIEQMHHRKTAALFCAALVFGGIIAQASAQTMTLLERFGTQFGQLFQMIDDLLDADHPLGQEKAQQSALSHFQISLDTLSHLPGDSSSLKMLTELVFTQCKNK